MQHMLKQFEIHHDKAIYCISCNYCWPCQNIISFMHIIKQFTCLLMVTTFHIHINEGIHHSYMRIKPILITLSWTSMPCSRSLKLEYARWIQKISLKSTLILEVWLVRMVSDALWPHQWSSQIHETNQWNFLLAPQEVCGHLLRLHSGF